VLYCPVWGITGDYLEVTGLSRRAAASFNHSNREGRSQARAPHLGRYV